jgi:hypothetical protein
MVVDQFNVKGVGALKTENNAPVGAYRHRPQPFQFASQRVQTIAGKIKRLRRNGPIENRQNFLNRIQQVGPDSAPRTRKRLRRLGLPVWGFLGVSSTMLAARG